MSAGNPPLNAFVLRPEFNWSGVQIADAGEFLKHLGVLLQTQQDLLHIHSQAIIQLQELVFLRKEAQPAASPVTGNGQTGRHLELVTAADLADVLPDFDAPVVDPEAQLSMFLGETTEQ